MVWRISNQYAIAIKLKKTFYSKCQAYHPEPAGNNLHHPENRLKKGVCHEVTVEERVVEEGIKDEFGVAQRLP